MPEIYARCSVLCGTVDEWLSSSYRNCCHPPMELDIVNLDTTLLLLLLLHSFLLVLSGFDGRHHRMRLTFNILLCTLHGFALNNIQYATSCNCAVVGSWSYLISIVCALCIIITYTQAPAIRVFKALALTMSAWIRSRRRVPFLPYFLFAYLLFACSLFIHGIGLSSQYSITTYLLRREEATGRTSALQRGWHRAQDMRCVSSVSPLTPILDYSDKCSSIQLSLLLLSGVIQTTVIRQSNNANTVRECEGFLLAESFHYGESIRTSLRMVEGHDYHSFAVLLLPMSVYII